MATSSWQFPSSAKPFYPEGCTDGSLNGTTVVEIVSPPSGTIRIVKTITISNSTDEINLTIALQNGATITRTIWAGTLAPQDTMFWGDGGNEFVMLDSNQKKIVAYLDSDSVANPTYV